MRDLPLLSSSFSSYTADFFVHGSESHDICVDFFFHRCYTLIGLKRPSVQEKGRICSRVQKPREKLYTGLHGEICYSAVWMLPNKHFFLEILKLLNLFDFSLLEFLSSLFMRNAIAYADGTATNRRKHPIGFSYYSLAEYSSLIKYHRSRIPISPHWRIFRIQSIACIEVDVRKVQKLRGVRLPPCAYTYI